MLQPTFSYRHRIDAESVPERTLSPDWESTSIGQSDRLGLAHDQRYQMAENSVRDAKGKYVGKRGLAVRLCRSLSIRVSGEMRF
jgi:hypothetical protein